MAGRVRASGSYSLFPGRLAWIGICLILSPSGTKSSAETDVDVEEYCEWEFFNATCGPDEVIMIQGARYGRMRTGRRCISQDYGNIDCSSDVTSELDETCSGRHSCVISVISLHHTLACPKDLKSYMEAGYKCVKVFYPPIKTCPESGFIPLTDTSGVISSIVTMETGLGSEICPFVIEVNPHQRINISLTDLTMEVGSNQWYYSNGHSSLGCLTLATIRENSESANRSICGGRTRDSAVYTTKGNRLEIRITGAIASKHKYLLKYQAVGCPPLDVPEDAWSQSYGDHTVVHCNHTEEAWYLTCRGDTWVGPVGNCSALPPGETAKNWNLSNVLGGVADFPLGILIVVTLGVAIGVAVGVMMLVAVLAYMKRRRRRKIRSRSNYILKHVTDNSGPHPLPTCNMAKIEVDPASHSDRTPMLLRRQQSQDSSSTPASLPRQHYLDTATWQRTRPLPRPTSDSGIEQETDGMTLTPESPSPSIFTTFRPEFERTMLLTHQLNVAYPGGGSQAGPGHPVREGMPPYYFKVDPSRHVHEGHYGRPDVLSTCTLCKNNTATRPVTNL